MKPSLNQYPARRVWLNLGADGMTLELTIRQATVNDTAKIAVMVGELLSEIMAAINTQAFHFDLGETTARLAEFLSLEKYFVFVALYESYAFYAEGIFGIIPELYVRPEFRSNGLGQRLVSRAKSFASTRGWRRLEVTTPPLPQFDRTLAFYEREGFSIAGGRKLKLAL
jgi:GNAT superfamily N-acetyltransferase